MSLGRVVVLWNSAAGPGAESGDQLGRHLERAFAAAGIEAVVTPIDRNGLAGQLGSLLSGAQEFDAVVVAGGDGTMRSAAEVLAGTGTALGVLPAGTFNHFAQDLGMPSGLDEAVAALAEAVATTVDVGEVNGRVFVNNSVLGVYPAVVDGREKLEVARGWGKLRATPVAVVRALRAFPTHRLDIETPDGLVRRRLRTPFVFIGNGEYANGAGGLPARRSLTGGRLGLAVADVTSRGGLVRAFVRAVATGAETVPQVHTTATAEVSIRVSGSVPVALDGEVFHIKTPLHYRSRPGALTVMVPQRQG